jgi:hypothetical protein
MGAAANLAAALRPARWRRTDGPRGRPASTERDAAHGRRGVTWLANCCSGDASRLGPRLTELHPGWVRKGGDLDAVAFVRVGSELVGLDVELPVELAVLGAVVREGVGGECQLERE